MNTEKLEFIMVAGCNAAGKSTFIRSRLNELAQFEILMTDVYKARTKELAREAIAQRKNFLVETVFNDASFTELADEARCAGYKTSLIVLFLDELQQSLSRVAVRGIKQSGISITGGNVKINFNESFKNVANYFFYFDRSDFLYTGAGGTNLSIVTFSKRKMLRYNKNEFEYVKKFASYSFSEGRLTEESYKIIMLNDDYRTGDDPVPVSALKI